MPSAFRSKDELALYKADIDSAYRRVPILPGRSWSQRLARPALHLIARTQKICRSGLQALREDLHGTARGSAIWCGCCGPRMASHWSVVCLLAFGALARSPAGALLRTVARKVLHLIIFQYVDDFFGPDQASNVQHAMESFARHTCLHSPASRLAWPV